MYACFLEAFVCTVIYVISHEMKEHILGAFLLRLKSMSLQAYLLRTTIYDAG